MHAFVAQGQIKLIKSTHILLKPSSHGCDLNMRLMLHHKAPTGRMR